MELCNEYKEHAIPHVRTWHGNGNVLYMKTGCGQREIHKNKIVNTFIGSMLIDLIIIDLRVLLH